MRAVSLAACLAALWLCLSGGTALADARVEQVAAQVTSQGAIPPLAQQRMQESVAAIAAQLLSGRKLPLPVEEQARQERLIGQVFDKVLVGYTVTGVRIEAGEASLVRVELMPWDVTVARIETSVAVEGMTPFVEDLVRRDAAGLPEVFQKALAGLPVAASDWTAAPLKHEVARYLEQHLPEFRADFELEPGELTRVSVTLYPRLPVVRTVDLSMRSGTVPNFTLLGRRYFMQKQVSELIGVPVAFVQRHQEDFEKEYAAGLDGLPEFSSLYLHTQLSLTAGERMQVMSRTDTSRYRLRLSGWLDMGHKAEHGHKGDKDLLLRFHGGAMLSGKDEIFVQADLLPRKPDWGLELGYSRRLWQGMELALRYDMREHRPILAAGQQLDSRGKWLLRYEYRWSEHLGEAALRYRLHDFLSLELVRDKYDGWLRLIGDF